MNRMEELEKILEGECEKYETDCTKCPYQKECNEYAEMNQEI